MAHKLAIPFSIAFPTFINGVSISSESKYAVKKQTLFVNREHHVIDLTRCKALVIKNNNAFVTVQFAERACVKVSGRSADGRRPVW